MERRVEIGIAPHFAPHAVLRNFNEREAMDDETDSDGSPTSFTWLQYADGQGCECVGCDKPNAVDEFFAYCPECWKNLTEQERAILRGEEHPVQEVIHHRTERTIFRDTYHRNEKILQWVYNLVMGAAVAWIYWRMRR